MIRQPVPGDNGTALARLAADLDRLEHDLADLTRLRVDVEAHTRALADLADLLRRLTTNPPTTDPDPGIGRVPEWLTVTDPADAVAWLAGVDQWTRDVWTHYTPLVPCWPWHPPVVAELLAVRVVWTAATVPGAAITELAAWHDRWRPGAATRIARATMPCERADGAHVLPGGHRYTIDPTVLDELALWWATTHATATPPPGLTPEPHR